MAEAWLVAFLFSVTMTLGAGDKVCTFTDQRGNKGNHNDWSGFQTVGTVDSCREFCSSMPECTAAEFSYVSTSCYLYEGQTTLEKSAEYVFMSRNCKEAPSQLSSVVKELSADSANAEIESTEGQHSTVMVNTTTDTRQPEASPDNQNTSVVVDAVSDTPHAMKTHPHESGERTKRSMATKRKPLPTTIPYSETSGRTMLEKEVSGVPETSEVTRDASETASSTVMVTSSSTSPTTDGTTMSQMVVTTPKRRRSGGRVRGRRRKGKGMKGRGKRNRKRSRKGKGKRRKNRKGNVKHEKKETGIDTQTSSTATLGSTTTSIPHLSQQPKESDLSLKTADLGTPYQELRIKGSGVTKPNKMIHAYMKTTQYKPVSSQASRDANRVDVATPRNTRRAGPLGNSCGRFCRNVYGIRTRHGVFVPLMKVQAPMMLPHRPVFTRFRPMYRVRVPIRRNLPPRPRVRNGHQYFVENGWVHRRDYVHSEMHVGSPPPPPPPPPSHAVIANAAPRKIPRRSNFRTAALQAGKVHHVAVIPGGVTRAYPSGRRTDPRRYQHGLKQTPKEGTTAGTRHKAILPSAERPVRKQEVKQEVKKAVLTRNDRKSSGVTTALQRSSDVTTAVQNDQQWTFKPHFNTYTLRLTIPMPISGYKKCFYRQELPNPPKILVVSFKEGGSFQVKSLHVQYPRRVCTFVKLGQAYPELYIPSPLTIFTGTTFMSDRSELRNIYVQTAPKAEYDVRSLQERVNQYRYTAIYNTPPLYRKLNLPIEIRSAVVSFDMARMGFIYHFTVRLPRVLRSKNLMVEDSIPSDVTFVKVIPDSVPS